MRTIRVLIREGPTMLRDILERAITNAPDMEAVLEPPEPTQEPVERQPPAPPSPDVVIVGVRESGPVEDASALLQRWPGCQVLMITAHGRKAVMYRMVPQETDMGEISPDQLVEAIRSSVRGRA
jgi:DNA-binding NarL/FixJ family response regulator